MAFLTSNSAVLFLALVFLLLEYSVQQGQVNWFAIPTIRAGQINSISTLTTSSDLDPVVTDQTSNYLNDLTGAQISDLKVGLSLMSYESWMTDTFSFNITLVAVTTTNITVRFVVLDNTFFTKAKVHYLVVWRNVTTSNQPLGTSPPLAPVVYNNIQVRYGCYLTPNLLIGTGNRTTTVGGQLTYSTNGTNHSNLVYASMIAGMRLNNSVGYNDYVDVETVLTNNRLYYKVTVQNNNFLEFICVTTVIYQPRVNLYYQMSIIQFKSLTLTNYVSGLNDIHYSERFDGTNRMFFGFSRFNLSMSDTRYLNVETTNISLVSSLYLYNYQMNQVIINMFFFAFRTCDDISYFYLPSNFSCVFQCPDDTVPYPSAAATNASYMFCNPCHYSCKTCTGGQDDTKCIDCLNTTHRTYSSNSCPCDTHYTDAGESICQLCNVTIGGCLTCSSPTHCLTCDTPKYVHNTTSFLCDCNNDWFLVTGFCLSYSGCILAEFYNNQVVCRTCDTDRNYIRNNTDLDCDCNYGYFKNSSAPDIYLCSDICGDAIAAVGHCDDNNTDPGDGCDQDCNVENGWHCTTSYNASNYPGLSYCVLISTVSINFLYAERIINSNKFKMAFSIEPASPYLTQTSFNSTNFQTTLPIQNQEIVYDPASSTIYLSAEYLQSIEGVTQYMNVSFSNTADFWAEDVVGSFVPKGINAQLVLEDYCSFNNIIKYVIMAEGIIAVLVAVFASVVGIKLAGIELLMPVQIIYFSFSAVSVHSSYASTLINLKHANGYSSIANYEYSRTYAQNKNLVSINYETEFLLSTNIMLGLYLASIVWLLVHHFVLKYKQQRLQNFLNSITEAEQKQAKNELNNSSDKQDPEQDEQKVNLRRNKPKVNPYEQEQNQYRQDHHYSLKIFSFQVDRIYFTFYLILINQMLFGFNVMGLNLPITTFQYPQEVSVIICNFMMFLFMGNIVFIYYDQQNSKMINFTCINDRYAYIYLITNATIIIILSFTFQEKISIYIITALTLIFIILIIKEKPYNQTLLELENLVALYNHIMLLVCMTLLCVMQSSTQTEMISFIFICLIAGLILIGEVLTIIRVMQKVNFKKAFDDLKNPMSDRDGEKEIKKRVIQKNLDLLGQETAQIVPPDSVRNGLFTPKDKMIDWQARNTEQYQSLKQKEQPITQENQQHQQVENEQNNDEMSSNKDEKLNELEMLKKRLRNNLKLKRQNESKKTD